jgi:predicted transcriptional regulator
MTVMTEFNLIPVPFHGDSVWAGQNERDVLVAVAPICANLGIDVRSQRRRIEATPILRKGKVMMTVPSPGGPQETLCLPLKLIPGWLVGLETRRVKPEIRERLEQYQAECYEALWAYFNGQTREPRPGQVRDAHAKIEAYLHPHQLRVLAAVKAHPGYNGAQLAEVAGLSEENVRRCLYLLWWIGVVQVVKGPDGSYIEVLPVEKRPAVYGGIVARRAIKQR